MKTVGIDYDIYAFDKETISKLFRKTVGTFLEDFLVLPSRDVDIMPRFLTFGDRYFNTKELEQLRKNIPKDDYFALPVSKTFVNCKIGENNPPDRNLYYFLRDIHNYVDYVRVLLEERSLFASTMVTSAYSSVKVPQENCARFLEQLGVEISVEQRAKLVEAGHMFSSMFLNERESISFLDKMRRTIYSEEQVKNADTAGQKEMQTYNQKFEKITSLFEAFRQKHPTACLMFASI